MFKKIKYTCQECKMKLLFELPPNRDADRARPIGVREGRRARLV
jgi:hypothetical protein